MAITITVSGGSESAAFSNPNYWRRIRQTLAFFPLAILLAWSAAAIGYDLPWRAMRTPVAVLYLAALIALFFVVKRRMTAVILALCSFLVVLAWWLTLRPSNDRPWQADVSRTPTAEVDGDILTLHNVRDFSYRTENDYTPRWETRSYNLSQITGLDLFVIHWGSPYIAHVIVSFAFEGSRYLAISIEARKEIGEQYSSIAGFFRRYELIYIAADERDVVRLRTNYRIGEETYLFHTVATPARARGILLDYLKAINRLRNQPEWYNALTSNCTTNIRVHTVASAEGVPDPWDWRYVINGYGAEMLYERHELTGDFPFDELQRQAHINAVAHASDDAPDFSHRIRVGRPGF